jgi:hypothetical protein
MEKTTWKESADRRLRMAAPSPTATCSVHGCDGLPTIAVAGDEKETTRMCTQHALAWSQSSLCRDFAQHNSGASPLALSLWLNVARTEGARVLEVPVTQAV